MCNLVLAWRVHANYPLVFAGNRDEFHGRPSAPASFWKDAPHLLAGRDLKAGGTWLGITSGQRFAVITNYRDGITAPENAVSRGTLVSEYLLGKTSAAEYAADVYARRTRYAGFNLLLMDKHSLCCVSNRSSRCGALPPGIYGLSNADLNTPWPKVTRSMDRLRHLLENGHVDESGLFALLNDRRIPPDEELPDTGIGLQLERRLAAPFVVGEEYGTRCSTLILQGSNTNLVFAERRFDPAGSPVETRIFHLNAVCKDV